MKKFIYLFIYSIISFTCYPQVGIHTETPAGMLEVTSGNDKKLGLVLPIVAKLEDVEHIISGEIVKRGTIVFDEQRNTICHKTITGWSCLNGDNIPDDTIPIDPSKIPPATYVKPSNTKENSYFGYSVSLSADGNILAVGSYRESSNATGINGNQDDVSMPNSGAVYVFTRNGTSWSQQAYIKASNTRVNSYFGQSISLSSDGNTLAVGANGESSNATGINGNQNDTSVANSGAVYIFTRNGTTWMQQAYVKASNTKTSNYFGASVSLSSDGNTLAVGAYGERSNATGINGNQNDTSVANSGAVYVFTRNGTTWSQQAYVKASYSGANASFGISVSLSSDGNTLAVGANGERSNATGINGNQTNTSLTNSGAVYVFTRNGPIWVQQAYIKASSVVNSNNFGISVSLSSDSNTLAVGAFGNASNATGINGNQNDTSVTSSGAVYVFTRNGTIWVQQAYIKASTSISFNNFGVSVSLSSNGNTLAVGAYGNTSNATGINGNQNDTSLDNAGAVYVFTRNGTTWEQKLYVKASNTDSYDRFGNSIFLSSNGNTLASGAWGEKSNATGVGGNQNDNSKPNAGAIYTYRIR